MSKYIWLLYVNNMLNSVWDDEEKMENYIEKHRLWYTKTTKKMEVNKDE